MWLQIIDEMSAGVNPMGPTGRSGQVASWKSLVSPIMSREHEHTLNVWLASNLQSQGLDAQPKSEKPGNRRLDFEVRIGPLSIAIEAEHGQSGAKKVSAIQDADARLAQRLAQCAIAVLSLFRMNRHSGRLALDQPKEPVSLLFAPPFVQ